MNLKWGGVKNFECHVDFRGEQNTAQETYLGIDVGSVTTKLAVLDGRNELVASVYLPTGGRPLEAIQQGLRASGAELPGTTEVRVAAATGSARHLAGAILGTDLVKNEITCQAAAAVHSVPDVRTIIEIGGQDSKLIIIEDGMVADFRMNTVCAAGTGSFLDHQAARLGMDIEEFSRRSLAGSGRVRIPGRCTVFAESDMVHKQQMGHAIDDVIYGLCRALVHNYLSDVSTGRDLLPPVVFQGGVAFNRGIARALEEELGLEIVIPVRPEITGAIGAAILAHEAVATGRGGGRFKGFDVANAAFQTSSAECRACPVGCEIVRVLEDGREIAAWGGRCDTWSGEKTGQEAKSNL